MTFDVSLAAGKQDRASNGRVVVVGAGIAGLAAAWSARRAGWEVTVVARGPGASALGSGAVDDVAWEDLLRAASLLGDPRPRSAPALGDACRAFVTDLDLWEVPAETRPWVATAAGRVRPARGRDRALLDLALLAGARVIVPRVDRPMWDADAIAAALGTSDLARANRMTFEAIDAHVLRFDDEHRSSDAELASRHDDDGRIDWLAARLRERLVDARGSAVLLGPWLGARSSRAAALSGALGLPCGEALVGVGSPAGLRFEAARDRLLGAIGVTRFTGHATRVHRPVKGAHLSVTIAGGAVLAADAVVVAIGGVAAGGVVYMPPERLKRDRAVRERAGFAFELSLDADVVLSMGEGRLEAIASTHGPDLDASAWPSGARPGALECVGIRCDAERAGDGIWAAGDAIAGRSRTVLEAVGSGLAAGAQLATATTPATR